jgi:hypothetical protein
MDDAGGAEPVRWSELRHAYGDATDIPQLLEAIGGADKSVRESAWMELWGNLFHQGTRYSASAAAVPFLIRFVTGGRAPDRDQALYYLIHLAIGYPDAWIETGCSGSLMRQRCREWARDAPEASEHAAAALRCYEAVQSNAATFVGFVNHRSKGVRQVSAFAAPFLLDHRRSWGPALRERWDREDDVSNRAVLALSLSYVDPLPADDLLPCLDPESPALTQLAAAVALARVGAVSEPVLATLRAYWTGARSVRLPRSFVWNMLVGQANALYLGLDPDAFEQAITRKIAAYEAGDWRGGPGPLLMLAFGGNAEGRPGASVASVDTLTASQIRVLSTIAEFDPPWTVSVYSAEAMSRTLEALGIAGGRAELRAVLRL